jgi:hypothetical protein
LLVIAISLTPGKSKLTNLFTRVEEDGGLVKDGSLSKKK